MNLFRNFMTKLSALFGRRRFRDDLDEEMAFHRAQVEKDLVARGMTARSCPGRSNAAIWQYDIA